MIKRVQNKVAESRLTLPVTILYGIGIWLLCGLLQQQWWVQFACFLVSTFLIIELNNGNALIRIYSRSVSAAYIILSCMACFLFPSMEGAIAQLCIVGSLLTSYHTYQDRTTVGWTFYTFMFISLASLVKVHALVLVPFYWILFASFLQSLGWRTFFASLLGLILPYWFMAAWALWRYQGDLHAFIGHFTPLADIVPAFGLASMSLSQRLTFAFIVILSITGIIHYFRTSFNDKLRVRLIFYSLIFLDVVSAILLYLQPQHYDLWIRIMIAVSSPLIAHFITLTYTRITNIAFYVIAVAALALTAFNLWSSSFIF